MTEVPASKADTTEAAPIAPKETETAPVALKRTEAAPATLGTTEESRATPNTTKAAPATLGTTGDSPAAPSTTEPAVRKGASTAGKLGALLVLVGSAAIALGLVPMVRWLSEGDEVEVIAWSLTTIVVFGAAGFILRGIGELYASAALKASGYFLNAFTWASTALLATLQGIPFLLEELGQ